jgi:ribonucleoside-diphosphate reductase alpha chain
MAGRSALTPGASPSQTLPAGQMVLAMPRAERDGEKDDEMKRAFEGQTDAPPCPTCGSITVRNGACYKCVNCGTTTGCS